MSRAGANRVTVVASFEGRDGGGEEDDDDDDFVCCVVVGEGLEQFSEEVVPNLVKLTSCKMVEDLDRRSGDGGSNDGASLFKIQDTFHLGVNGFGEDDDEEEGDSGDDDDDSMSYYSESDPLESVFVEESLSPSSASSSTGGPSAGGGGGFRLQPGGQRRPRSKSTTDFSCRGCGAKFKYKNSYLKHEAQCGLASIPADVLALPNLADGRKPCPGCGKGFVGVNLFYLKHLRACPRVRFGGFRCRACGAAPFSSARTLAIHSGSCPGGKDKGGSKGGRNGDGLVVPEIAKKIKIENVVSLKKEAAAAPPPPSPAPPAFVTQTRNTWVNKVDKHEAVCKVGDYTCPLCFVKFRLNQPYGKHVKSQECLDRKADVKAPPKNKLAMLNFSIIPGVKGDDTVVAFNRVSVRMSLLRVALFFHWHMSICEVTELIVFFFTTFPCTDS